MSDTSIPALADDASADSAEPPQRLSVDIVIEDETWQACGDAKRWINVAATALADSGASNARGIAVVALADDETVRALNLAHRGFDKPTNVLSYPATTHGGESHLGDIVFARETIVREAQALGVPFAHHVQHLTIHGLLHLLGYDHETEAEALVMESLETRILASIGVADPYAGDDPA